MARSLSIKMTKSNSLSQFRADLMKEAEKEFNVIDDILGQNNLNSEIVGLIASEVMEKHEFYDMMKNSALGKKDLAQKSKLMALEENDSSGALALSHLNNIQNMMGTQDDVQQTQNGPGEDVQQRKKMFKRLTTNVIDDIIPDHYLKSIVEKAQSSTQGQPKDMIQRYSKEQNVLLGELAKAEFIKDCDRNLVVGIPLLLRIKN